MSYLRVLLISLIVLPLSAQSTRIEVEAAGCKAMYLYQFNGAGFDTEATFTSDAAGIFALTAEFDEPKFRYVGTKPSDALPLLISPGESVAVSGPCNRMRSAKVTGSSVHDGYQELKAQFQADNGAFTTVTKAYQNAFRQKDTVAQAQHLAELQALDERKVALVNRMKQDAPLLGRIASVNTYLSYLTANKGRFPNELDYFVNTYFQHVDYKDSGYNDLPWTYEGNKNFATTLSSAVPGDNLANILLQIYSRWPAGSRAQLFAMSGGFNALVQKKHPAAVPLADEIVARFGKTEPAAVNVIKQQAAGLRAFSIGAEAPTFAADSPDGELIGLESLRGKVVLIDFWASWCGPCRRENPNVVKVYEEYKNKGFEILAVSLDSNKERWLKAIADDKLTWLHVSELKGWKGDISRQYGVSSIPQTVLLDAEGRILARNLRGAALEQKLAEVFAGK